MAPISSYLRNILSAAQKIRAFCDKGDAKSDTSSTSSQLGQPPEVISPIPFPRPVSILPHLLPICATESIAQRLSEIYLRRAESLRGDVTHQFKQACLSAHFPSELRSRLHNSLNYLYEDRLESLKSKIITAVDQRRKLAAQEIGMPQSEGRKSRSFNQGFVKVLEAIFEENPCPNRADRMKLASKSGMTLRQIEIWFQNRRRRSKRGPDKQSDVRGPHKLESFPSASSPKPTPTPTTPQTPSTGVSSFPTPEHHICDASLKVSTENPLTLRQTPAFAFPKRYPPDLDDDNEIPFPCKFGQFISPILPWPRKPKLCISTKTDVPDIESLTVSLKKMECRTPTQNQGDSSLGCIVASNYWWSPIPSRRNSRHIKRKHCFDFPESELMGQAPSKRRKTHSSPSLDNAELLTLPSSSRQIDISATPPAFPRKIAPLPRRIPKDFATQSKALISATLPSKLDSKPSSRVSSFESASSLPSLVRSPSNSTFTSDVSSPSSPLDSPSKDVSVLSNTLAASADGHGKFMGKDLPSMFLSSWLNSTSNSLHSSSVDDQF